MASFCSTTNCVQPETLVIMEAIPICLIPPADAFALALKIERQPVSSSSYESLPARFACIMPCSQVLTFAKENGYVAF